MCCKVVSKVLLGGYLGFAEIPVFVFVKAAQLFAFVLVFLWK